MRASVVLPTPRGPAEQDRVGHAPAADRVAQRCRDVSLAAHVVEALRAPLARENLVAHRRPAIPPPLPRDCRARPAPSRDRRAPPLATESSLPLLPSGPDGVHEVRDRAGPCDRGSPQGELRLYPRGSRGSNAARGAARGATPPQRRPPPARAPSRRSRARRARRLAGRYSKRTRRVSGADAHGAEEMVGALDRRLGPIHAGAPARVVEVAEHQPAGTRRLRPRRRPAPGRRRRSRRAAPPTRPLRSGRARRAGSARSGPALEDHLGARIEARRAERRERLGAVAHVARPRHPPGARQRRLALEDLHARRPPSRRKPGRPAWAGARSMRAAASSLRRTA